MAVATSTLLIASLVATTVGTGVVAYNQYQQGKAARALGNYNAQVSEQAALDAARDGRAAANAQRAKNEAIKARQRALFAKAGVNLSSGSPLMLQVAQAGELELAALETEQQAESNAAKLRTQAVLDRMGANSAYRAGLIGASGTILQGVGTATNTALIGRYKGV